MCTTELHCWELGIKLLDETKHMVRELKQRERESWIDTGRDKVYVMVKLIYSDQNEDPSGLIKCSHGEQAQKL